MKKLMAALAVSVFCVSTVMASEYYCTRWAKQGSLTCIFAGRSVSVWERQCENPCAIGPFGPAWSAGCDMESACSPVDPNTFTSACGEWAKDDNITCQNPETQSFEQQWVRVCTKGLRQHWCSAKRPSFK